MWCFVVEATLPGVRVGGRGRWFVHYALVEGSAIVKVSVDVEGCVSVELGDVRHEEDDAIRPVAVFVEECAAEDEASFDGFVEPLLVAAGTDAGDVVLAVFMRVAEGQ